MFSLFSFWRIQLWFAPTWKATETNFKSISFSRQLQLKETSSSTQNCTAPATPVLLCMRPYDELDRATDLNLGQANQKGAFLTQTNSSSTQSNRKLNHHNKGGGAEVGVTTTKTVSERNAHKTTVLNSVCSKQYKIKKQDYCFKKQIFFN